jgi:ABC-type proline/glycine betaine transport system permease subunit
VAATVISNSLGEIILAVTQKHSVSDILIGEASTALLATRLTASMGIGDFML